MFINAANVFGIVSLYRLLWIGGRFGGYKTSLAFRMAKPYLERGYRLITNCGCAWADDPGKVKLDENGKLRAVVVLDEGGIEIKAGRQIEEMAAYARKMDVIYIFPSFWPPVRQAQVLTIQPLFNFKQIGVPLVVYRWRVRLGAFEDKGVFGWYDPSEMYGIYSTKDPGDRAASIIQFLLERKDQYRKSFGYNDGFSEVAEVTEADILSDAVNSLAEAADTLSAIPIRVRGRRR